MSPFADTLGPLALEPLKERKHDGMIWDSKRATAIITNQTQ